MWIDLVSLETSPLPVESRPLAPRFQANSANFAIISRDRQTRFFGDRGHVNTAEAVLQTTFRGSPSPFCIDVLKMPLDRLAEPYTIFLNLLRVDLRTWVDVDHIDPNDNSRLLETLQASEFLEPSTGYPHRALMLRSWYPQILWHSLEDMAINYRWSVWTSRGTADVEVVVMRSMAAPYVTLGFCRGDRWWFEPASAFEQDVMNVVADAAGAVEHRFVPFNDPFFATDDGKRTSIFHHLFYADYW